MRVKENYIERIAIAALVMLVLTGLEPSPEGFNIISEFRLESRSGPYWAHMAIFNKKLFVRHGEVLFVYDIDKS